MDIAGTSQVVVFSVGHGVLAPPTQAQVIVETPVIQRAPDVLQFRVVGADPGATLTFTSLFGGDDVVLWVDVANVEGELDVTTIDLPADFTAGSYTLDLATDNNGSSFDEYEILLDPIAFPADATGDEPPQVVPDSGGRWVIQDPGGIGSWVMPVNPTTMTNPHFERNVNVRHTTSPYGGQFSASEASFTGKPWRISGYCPDRDFYAHLYTYAELHKRLYVIDHRGRAWKVGIQGLTVEPRKRQQADDGSTNDWAANWTMDLLIYDQAPSIPVDVP